MPSFTDIIGAIVQSKLNRSSEKRLENALRSGGSSSQGAKTGDQLPKGTGVEGIGETLQRVLGDASRLVRGNQQLAVASLGALAAMLFRRGGKHSKGLIGGGAMAMLGALAYAAMKGTGSKEPEVPIGLREPQGSEEKQLLEQRAELVMKAMINAAKADGEIDEQEMQRISGKLREVTLDEVSRQRLLQELRAPLNTDELVFAASGRPELAAQLYAASLLTIEVDTPAERAYMEKLASSLGLTPEVVQRLESMVGMRQTVVDEPKGMIRSGIQET